MLCSLFARNGFLISGVVISHALVLMGLLYGSLGRDASSAHGALMVNLMGERANSPKSNQSFASQQTASLPSTKSSSPIQADESSAAAGVEGASRLAGAIARKAIHNPKPHYPLASRQLREEGLVVVRLCVDQQGIVGEIGVSKSSGFQNLDHSALKALAKWRFDPIALNSTNHSAQCFQTPVQFTLEG
ncbi:energy transducer TonB [Polynucleobacter sp. JS-Polo-80-F4]|uniref:energy transducer TonB n=1 Tax=Polynucleobacter sp. JS-Polo-80-F4 TaxID=2576918 RepID=UPI001C0CE723|nr:energy transducer TonB [Polynucleobacter sp. JS-Polo-80-F4]MBU3615925.1 energy transducer TonB [Polynucleobacter sp. JS-Polo-80-F4]